MDDKSIDASHLAQEWLHSHEEDTPTMSVYRPASFAFPPSRGRKGFCLQVDGTMTARQPGPTDRTETSAGKWTLSGDQLELLPHGENAQRMRVVAVEQDRLVVKKPGT